MRNAPLLVALANAGRERRPPRAPAPVAADPLADPKAADRLLGSFLGRPARPSELPGLRSLQREASGVAAALIGGVEPRPKGLNRLAARCLGHVELAVAAGGDLEARVRWHRAPAAATLARMVIAELAALDPSRLRRCARSECELIFYDSTRSGTQRWHSESPCGWRERQSRRRRRSAPALAPDS